MTAHSCTTLNPLCFRCDLNLDEMDSDRLDHLRVAKLLRKVAASPRRRPGTRGLLLHFATDAEEYAAEVQKTLDGTGRTCSFHTVVDIDFGDHEEKEN